MSTNFEIFPTSREIPKCSDIVKLSLELFNFFLKRYNIKFDMSVEMQKVIEKEIIVINQGKLITDEKNYQILNVNGMGEIFLLFRENTELDECFWEEELKTNIRAQNLSKEIEEHLNIGYSWCVKKIASQPAAVSLYYGFVAIAIAMLTKGIIFSSDGAWESNVFPIMGQDFLDEYLYVEKITGHDFKEQVIMWINDIKG